jgi:tetratricopeptide (TPR) repeat protein
MVYPLLRLARRAPPRGAWRRTVPFLVVAAVFMIHRRLVIGQSAQTAPISGSYAQTLIDTLATGPIYLRLVLGIPPFFIDYSFLPAGRALASPSALARAALGAGLLVAAARGWRRKGRAPEVFGLLWFAAFMLPVSNLLPMMQYMAERFLYLPVIGALVVAGALVLRCGRPRLALAVMAFVLLAWSWVSWGRASIWRDELTLFVTSSQQGERIPRVEQNAVAAIFELPQIRSVFRLDAKTGHLVPVAAASPANRRTVEQTLAQARVWFPENTQVLTAAGIFYAQAGEAGRAASLFSAVCRREPGSADAWANLGRAELSLVRLDAAKEDFTRSLGLNPNHLEALRGASSLDWQRQDYAGALGLLEKLKMLEPKNTNHQYWIEQARERLLKPAR